MTTIEKQLKKLFEHPRNIRFSELDSVMLTLGYEKRQSGTGGSHYVYSHPDVDMLVVLVSHGRNDVLPDYQVKKALKSVKKLLEEK